jgi:hypothetical protein
VQAQAWKGSALRPAVADCQATKRARMRKRIVLLNHVLENPKIKLI